MEREDYFLCLFFVIRALFLPPRCKERTPCATAQMSKVAVLPRRYNFKVRAACAFSSAQTCMIDKKDNLKGIDAEPSLIASRNSL